MLTHWSYVFLALTHPYKLISKRIPMPQCVLCLTLYEMINGQCLVGSFVCWPALLEHNVINASIIIIPVWSLCHYHIMCLYEWMVPQITLSLLFHMQLTIRITTGYGFSQWETMLYCGLSQWETLLYCSLFQWIQEMEGHPTQSNQIPTIKAEALHTWLPLSPTKFSK